MTATVAPELGVNEASNTVGAASSRRKGNGPPVTDRVTYVSRRRVLVAKWEYLVWPFSLTGKEHEIKDMAKKLNELGSDRWELVVHESGPFGYGGKANALVHLSVLKRPVE